MAGKNNTSFQITLSALSCAIAVIFLTLGTLNTYLLFACFVVAEVALMLPLAKQFYWGGALAYVGCCILTILLGAIGNIWRLLPFIAFFGLHPLANALQLKFKINKWLALGVKTVWFDLTCWLTVVVVFGGTLGSGGQVFDFINQYLWAFIIFGCSAVAFGYDYMAFQGQDLVNKLVYRIKK